MSCEWHWIVGMSGQGSEKSTAQRERERTIGLAQSLKGGMSNGRPVSIHGTDVMGRTGKRDFSVRVRPRWMSYGYELDTRQAPCLHVSSRL